jgi:2-hydroxychromene-2-carboxylate isomerase
MELNQGNKMQHVDYYMTPLSPYTYLAGDRLERIAADHGAGISYKPVDAMQLFSRMGGISLGERHPARIAYMAQDLARTAARLGMKIDLRPAFFPTNPAPAAYAIIAAQKAGGGDLGGLVAAFPRAVWAEGRNIAEDETVRALLAAHGFDPAIADRYMLAAAETYAANLEEAAGRGVFGAPSYLVGDQLFWGQDRLMDLDLHLAALGTDVS